MDNRSTNNAARDRYEATLHFLYGPRRAEQILDGGDPAHQADVAAWRRLGRKRGAA